MKPRYDDLELYVPPEGVRREAGGPVHSGGEYWVGDHGPEMVVTARPRRRFRPSVLDIITAIALIVIAVLVIVALTPAPSGGSNPGQLHGAGLTGSVLRGAPEPQGYTSPNAAAAPRYAGTATWYCGHGSRCTRGYGPSDMVAAIDSDLGFRKGQSVVVRYRDRAVTVRIVDVCGCAGERLIDLTSGAFSRLAPLGLGVLPVTVEAASGIRLPATDTVP